MSQEESKDSGKLKYKRLIVLVTAIGICCMGQYFVVGIINLIRGYSMGRFEYEWIMQAGVWVFIILMLILQLLKKPKLGTYYSLTISFVIIYSCVASSFQGDYKEKGEQYYNAGQYQQALESYQKETNTWYNRLKYNYHERIAMFMSAKSYCQLEDFESACKICNVMMDRYHGEYYGYRAQELLPQIIKGLEVVAVYPEHVKETKRYPKELYNIAQAYQFNLNCYKKAIEVYTKIVDMDIDERFKELAKEQISKLKINAEKN